MVLVLVLVLVMVLEVGFHPVKLLMRPYTNGHQPSHSHWEFLIFKFIISKIIFLIGLLGFFG